MKYADLPHDHAALAIFPSRDGFGWMLFDGPLAPVDWDVSTLARKSGAADEKNARCMARIEWILKAYRPGSLVLEAFEGPGTRRSKRIKRLCHSIVALAATDRMPLRIISRAEIAACFVSSPAKTREEVAATTAKYVPEIAHRLPHKRKLWGSEEPVMALFAATALLIAHYANPAEPL